MGEIERVAAEVDVLEANRNFYRAFGDANFDLMSRVWAERAPSVCAHPGLPPIVGRSAILRSWQTILEDAVDWEITCRGERVYVVGDLAFVTCFEASGEKPAHLVATNVFVSEDGQWRMVHHHAGPLSEPLPVGPISNSAN